MFNERGHWQKLPRMSASKKLSTGPIPKSIRTALFSHRHQGGSIFIVSSLQQRMNIRIRHVVRRRDRFVHDVPVERVDPF